MEDCDFEYIPNIFREAKRLIKNTKRRNMEVYKVTIITRQDCPPINPRYDEPQPIAKGKVLHRKTNYKTMIHGLRLRLDREPTDSEIYAYLLEVNK